MFQLGTLLKEFDLTLLSADSGLDNEVTWVHISELGDPTRWLSGSEVLLTTGLQLVDSDSQREFITRLADRKIAALGFGIGFLHSEVPSALLEQAKSLNFPVFEVPYELPFIALTNFVAGQVINRDYALLKEAISFQKQLEDAVLAGSGLDGLSAALAGGLGGSAMVFDRVGELLSQAGSETLPATVFTRVKRQIEQRFSGRSYDGFELVCDDLVVIGAPTIARERSTLPGVTTPEAWLVLAKSSESRGQLDDLVIHQAATVVALEMLRSRVKKETAQRLAGSIFIESVKGESAGDEIGRRIGVFGVSGDVSVIALMLDQKHREAEDLRLLERAVADDLDRLESPALVAISGVRVYALFQLSGRSENEFFDFVSGLQRRLEMELDTPVSVGIGRPGPLEALKRNYQESEWALDVSLDQQEGSGGSGVISSYRDLGSLQLILGLQDQTTLRLFADSILAPIESGEGQYGDELLRSLQVFLEENGQWERAAGRLYCHRHTLRYRVKKIEELTGRDLSSASDRIEFWLALKARQVVS